jgi:hypothetical protein
MFLLTQLISVEPVGATPTDTVLSSLFVGVAMALSTTADETVGTVYATSIPEMVGLKYVLLNEEAIILPQNVSDRIRASSAVIPVLLFDAVEFICCQTLPPSDTYSNA